MDCERGSMWEMARFLNGMPAGRSETGLTVRLSVGLLQNLTAFVRFRLILVQFDVDLDLNA